LLSRFDGCGPGTPSLRAVVLEASGACAPVELGKWLPSPVTAEEFWRDACPEPYSVSSSVFPPGFSRFLIFSMVASADGVSTADGANRRGGIRKPREA
jgi:hypothetical protein